MKRNFCLTSFFINQSLPSRVFFLYSILKKIQRVNDVVSHFSSLFPYVSESVCFKNIYLKNLDFHTR